MSSPTEIKLKIILGKDTPDEVIDYLKKCIESNRELTPFTDHEFFRCNRWEWIFNHMGYEGYLDPSIKEIPRGWELIIHTDINYESGEIEEFVNWMRPFIWGRRKKVYLGWYERDWSTEKKNVYLNR